MTENYRIDDPRMRYLNDPEFKVLVDSLLRLIKNCQFTPFELKQALTLALTIHEETSVRPFFLAMKEEDKL